MFIILFRKVGSMQLAVGKGLKLPTAYCQLPTSSVHETCKGSKSRIISK
jgi:hypothetical protein